MIQSIGISNTRKLIKKIKIPSNISDIDKVVLELKRLNLDDDSFLTDIPQLFKNLRTSQGISIHYDEEKKEFNGVGVYIKNSDTDTNSHITLTLNRLQKISKKELDLLIKV